MGRLKVSAFPQSVVGISSLPELMRQLTFGLLLVLVGAAVVRAETSTAEGPTQELAIYAVQRLFPRTATVKDLVCREKQQMLKVRWSCTVYWED